jgi:hypothetical protein
MIGRFRIEVLGEKLVLSPLPYVGDGGALPLFVFSGGGDMSDWLIKRGVTPADIELAVATAYRGEVGRIENVTV